MLKYLAKVKVYTCRKCGMCIQSNSQPSGRCTAGGSHSWAITYI